MPFTKKREYIFDKTDRKLLKILTDINSKDLKGYPMARKVFPNSKSASEEKQNYKTVKGRIDNFIEIGILIEEHKKDGTPIWVVLDCNVCFNRFKMPNGIKDFICVRVDDAWHNMQMEV